MGRLGGLGDQNNVWSTMDLFRYSAPGVADYTNGRDGKATYFSSNATGLSSLIFNNEYNSGGTKNNQRDTADFVQADVFGTGAPGETNTLSQTDIAIMDALGWKRGSVPLQGAAPQYVIVDNNGALYIQDMVTGRGGAQILPTAKKMQFTDGVGLFDPAGAAEDVARLYQAFLRRPPDVSGLAAWTTEIDESHVPLSAVANSFAASPEFIQASGGLSEDSFVRDMYLNALGRSMDAGGEQAWDNALASGMGRGEVALQFAESPEGRRNTLSFAGDKNDAATYRLYQAAFARTPDQAGQIYWSSGLASGATPSQVAQGFTPTREFWPHPELVERSLTQRAREGVATSGLGPKRKCGPRFLSYTQWPVRAPTPAPPAPPIRAPVPAPIPVALPTAAPPPAPSKPPVTARVPRV